MGIDQNRRSGTVLILVGVVLPLLFGSTHVQGQSGTAAEFAATYPGLSTAELIADISNGSALARWELANRYALGSHGFDRDPAAAAGWYSRAASIGAPGVQSLQGLPVGPLRVDRTRASRPRVAPQAVITASAVSGEAPLTVELDGSSSSDDGIITVWSWQLGAGDVVDGAQTSVTYPLSGEYQVSLTVLDDAGQLHTAVQSITVTNAEVERPATPQGVFPAQYAEINEGQEVSFRWEAEPTASSYDFLLFSNDGRGFLPAVAGLQAVNICRDGECTWSATPDLPIGANHQWRVRAVNAAGVSSYSQNFVDVVSPVTALPDLPEPLAPADHALFESGQDVIFRWSRVNGASRYELQLLDLGDAVDPVLVAANLPASSCTASSCQLSVNLDFAANDELGWRVRASNAVGVTAWQERSLRLVEPATEAPGPPGNISPEVGADIVNGTEVTFRWTPAARATTYDFHLFDAINGSLSNETRGLDPGAVCSADECQWATTVTLPLGSRHAWRVRASNSLGQSSYTRSLFSVVDAMTEVPAAPQPLAPAAGAVVVSGDTVIFSWEPSVRASRYEVELLNSLEVDAEPVTAFVPASGCTSDTCAVDITVSLPAAPDHQWRVRARNDIGVSDWASERFGVADENTAIPAPPQVIAPGIDDAITAGTDVVFSWGADPLALAYDLQVVAADSGAMNPVVEIEALDLDAGSLCNSNVCSYTLTADLSEGTGHEWRVRALNEQGASDYTVTGLSVVGANGREAPQARFVLPGYSGTAAGSAPFTVAVDASDSTDDVEIISYTWDWGDGSEPVIRLATEADASGAEHTYTEAGDYTLTLVVTDSDDLTASTSRQVRVVDPGQAVDAVDAARLLTQATFGPTRSTIATVQGLGIDAWLDQQMSLQGPPHLDYVRDNSNGSGREARHEVWWRDVVEGRDQLRQRVAFALSEIFVVSDVGYTLGNSQYGMTRFYDILRENAFGNYRDLLEQVTLSPVMGIYLSMLQNASGDEALNTRADENFAREVLQLFSIGLYNLNLDGSSTGVNSFTQDHVEAYARVFTGWNYANATRWDQPLFTGGDLVTPMAPNEAYHDTSQKVLLSDVTVPAGGSARADLELALDSIFAHPNVGPFIGKQLIQRLVTSNPGPGYVARVASAFNDNGNGVRGDLGAVVRAVLTDEEARELPVADDYGKLREPVLRLSHLWRAFNITRGNQSTGRGEFNTYSPQLNVLDSVTGQAPLKSPSVFNFFSPGFAPAGPVLEAGLEAPEFQLFVEATELSTSNRIGAQIQRHYAGNPSASERNPSYLDFSYEVSLADDVDALLDHLDLLLLSGSMSVALRDALDDHVSNLPDDTAGLSQRVRDAVTLIMASPDYLVQL